MEGMETGKMKRGNGSMKATPQRLAIMEYLEGNRNHPSAADIFKAVAKKFPTMSLATVYNTMEALKERGIVVEIDIDADKKRFDPDLRPHHHLICVRCKTIMDIFKTFPLLLSGDEKLGFDIMGNHVQFYGLCPRCKEAVPDKEQ